MLNSRIKKIEAGFSENNLRFCGCYDAFMNQKIDGIYNETSYETDDSSLPKGFCEKCQKPVNTEFIDSFYANLAVVMPMYENYEIQMSVNVGPASVPAGMLSRSDVAAWLEIKLDDVERYIRSGRLRTDGSKRFVSEDSCNELKTLIRQRNEPPERF
jgi:hypothetical protein